MHYTPKAILPKYLWNYVIEYLSLNDLTKTVKVNSTFDILLDANDWKIKFMDKRKHDIVVIKCRSKRMDNFWIYAWYNYTPCVDFDNIFSTIEADNRINADIDPSNFIYYKVFVKGGIYNVVSTTYVQYDFNNKSCSIEIIGCNNRTIVEFATNTVEKIGAYRKIIIPRYFSIKHITFKNNSYIFNRCKYCYDHYSHLIDIRQPKTNSNIILYNCSFINNELWDTAMYAIRSITISKCRFTNVDIVLDTVYILDIDDSIFNNSLLFMCNMVQIKVNYMITNSIFSNIVPISWDCTFMRIGGLYDSSSNIIITNNHMTNANTLCINNSIYATVIYRSNIISDINSVAGRTTMILGSAHTDYEHAFYIFENNTFTNVRNLNNINPFNAQPLQNTESFARFNNNIFNNCSEELTNHD